MGPFVTKEEQAQWEADMATPRTVTAMLNGVPIKFNNGMNLVLACKADTLMPENYASAQCDICGKWGSVIVVSNTPEYGDILTSCTNCWQLVHHKNSTEIYAVVPHLK